MEDLLGDGGLIPERVFRSAREREVIEVEEFVCAGGPGGGWVVRARDDLRGLILSRARKGDEGSIVVVEVLECLWRGFRGR